MGVGPAALGPAALGLAALWMAALCGYDIVQRRLPNWLTLSGALVILAVAADAGCGGPALAGAVGLASLYLLVHTAAPTKMGAGDVKLALGLGALTGCFGAAVWFFAALAAPVATAAWGLVSRTRMLPHGPAMCLATAVALCMVR